MKEQSTYDNEKEDPYPWLEKDDPCREMTDEEILDKYIDLSNLDLTLDEKETHEYNKMKLANVPISR